MLDLTPLLVKQAAKSSEFHYTRVECFAAQPVVSCIDGLQVVKFWFVQILTLV